MIKPALARAGSSPHRGHDPRRVPQVHRKGRGPRAALPAGLRRRAPSRTPSPSCEASRRSTKCTTGCASKTPRSWPRPPCRSATSRTDSCPTRPSTSSTRRPRGYASRSTPCPPSSMSLSERIRQLDIERMALENETDDASKDRREKLEAEYAPTERAVRRAGRALAGRETGHHQDPNGETGVRRSKGRR